MFVCEALLTITTTHKIIVDNKQIPFTMFWLAMWRHSQQVIAFSWEPARRHHWSSERLAARDDEVCKNRMSFHASSSSAHHSGFNYFSPTWQRVPVIYPQSVLDAPVPKVWWWWCHAVRENEEKWLTRPCFLYTLFHVHIKLYLRCRVQLIEISKRDNKTIFENQTRCKN